jgi:hypothetical protein
MSLFPELDTIQDDEERRKKRGEPPESLFPEVDDTGSLFPELNRPGDAPPPAKAGPQTEPGPARPKVHPPLIPEMGDEGMDDGVLSKKYQGFVDHVKSLLKPVVPTPIVDALDAGARRMLEPKTPEAPGTPEGEEKRQIRNMLASQAAPVDPITGLLLKTEAAKRATASMVSGTAGTAARMVASIPAAEALFDKDTIVGQKAQKVADSLKKVAGDLMPENPNFLESHLLPGAASMALFIPAGLGAGGVAMGASRILSGIPRMANLATKLAPAIGAGVSSIFESGAEGGGTYQDMIDKGFSRDVAAKAAFEDFWKNVILVGATNKLGIFGDTLKGFKKGLASAPLEFIQEAAQDIIAAVAKGPEAIEKGDRVDWMQPVLSGITGAIIGFGTGAVVPGFESKEPETTITDKVMGTEGSAYLKGKFPQLYDSINNHKAPLPEAKIRELLVQGAAAGEEVILNGGTAEEANAAALDAFSKSALPLLEEAQAKVPKLAQKATEELKPSMDELLMEFDPAKLEAETGPAKTQELENDAIEPTSTEIAKMKIRLKKSEVEAEAKYLHERAIQDRDFKFTPLEKFVKENGGIATYKQNVQGVKEELEEYQNIPVRLRGQVSYDEMSQRAREAGVLPADAPYSALYDELGSLEKRGETPKVEDFVDEARRNLEYEKIQDKVEKGELPMDAAANYSATRVQDLRGKAKVAAQKVLQANKIDDRVLIDLVDAIEVDAEAFKAGYGEGAKPEDFDFRGETKAVQSPKIQAVINLAKGATEATGRHEAFHAVSNILLDESENQIITKKYGDMEKAADAFGEYRAGQSTNDSIIDKIFEKIKAFLERFSNYLDTKKFATADDLFKSIEEGRLAERATRSQAKAKYSAQEESKPRARFIGYQEWGEGTPPMALYNITGEHPNSGSTVGLEDLDAQNIPAPSIPTFEDWKSEQQQVKYSALKALRKLLPKTKSVKPELQSPEFQRWFGDSKVVDEDGNPKMVFHGTTASFNQFDPNRRELGFHFGDANLAANRLNQGIPALPSYDRGASIMPVYLNLKNPMPAKYDVGNWASVEDVKDAIGWTEKTNIKTIDDLRNALQEEGFDGIVYPNQYETRKGEGARESFIAFNAEQIKSAFNLGTWNVANPDVRYSAKKKQTETPEFKKWFGESKVVDKAGKPLVVYHGTREKIDRFDPNQIGSYTPLAKKHGVGFYFSDNPDIASAYAETAESQSQSVFTQPEPEYEAGGNVVPAYLSIENPQTYDAKGGDFRTVIGRALSMAKKNGRDGVVVKNVYDNASRRANTEIGPGTTYIVFKPTQIKSATGNIGSFNPNTPDIRYSAVKKPGQEHIQAAALKLGDEIFTGVHHGDALVDAVVKGHDMDDRYESGFVTNEGRFLSRDEALKLAEDQGQIQSTPIGRMTSDDVRYSAERKKNAPTFYSQLEKVIEAKVPAKASPEMIKNIVSGQDVKQEEVEWSGIKEWLAEQKGSLTKEQVLEFLKQNRVQVQEVVKGETREVSKEQMTAEPLGNGDWNVLLEGNVVNTLAASNAQDAISRTNITDSDRRVGGTTKFEKYTLPGGENYRELLLTLPPTINQLPQWKVIRPDGHVDSTYASEESARVQADRRGTGYTVKQGETKQLEGGFHSSHFPEPNILAHIRFNERTDAEGKRVLFIEEVQSDWHQRGRDYGYVQELPDNLKVLRQERDSLASRAVDAEGNDPKAYERLMDRITEINLVLDKAQSPAAVPNAPFKKTWHELSLKRMLRWAAENNFDRIAWTTGEQQAERYDLSKQVERIGWARFPDGSYNVTITPKDGSAAIIRDRLKSNELSDLVGKEVAKGIEADKGVPTESRERVMLGEVKGPSLRVGGEGMKGFYDQIIPSFLNKYTKKWGGRVGDTEIKTFRLPPTLSHRETEYGHDVVDQDGDYILQGASDAELERFLKKEGWSNEAPEPIRFKAHSLDLTPDMKKSVLEMGQPQYSAKIVPRYEAKKSFDEDFYKMNRKLQPTAVENIGRDFKSTIRDVKHGIDKYFGILSTRLKNIHPSLKRALRKYEINTGLQTIEDLQKAKPLLDKIAKLPVGDQIDFDIAAKNGDMSRLSMLYSKHNLWGEHFQYRQMENGIYKRAHDVGLEFGYLENHFPRKIKDARGFNELMAQREDWPIIETAINAKAEALKRPLTEEEKAQVINSLIRGTRRGLSSLNETGNMKDRLIDQVDPLMNRYYFKTPAAMIRYIREVNNVIEARRFFGKASIEKMPAVFGHNAEMIDVDNSIGGYILDLLNQGLIKETDQNDLRSMLAARFSPKGPGTAMGIARNIAYINAMGSFTSALTQVGDVGLSLYRGGWGPKAAYLGGALAGATVGGIPGMLAGGALGPIALHKAKQFMGKKMLTRADVGFDNIAQEFEDPGRSYTALSKVFKWIQLDRMDRLGKEMYINNVLDEYKSNLKNPKRFNEVTDRLTEIFGKDEVSQVIADLETGKITQNVKYLLASELLDVQPVAMSEVPEGFLTAGNGRVMYMLKLFQLKQIDVFRNEAFQRMQSSDRRVQIDGFRRLLYLSAVYMMANSGADVLKNLWLNRPTYLPDMVVDNWFRLLGISKFIIYDARRRGLYEAGTKLILPPFKIVDALYRDFANFDFQKDGMESLQGNFWKGEKLETPASIPVFGKEYYWWFGKGTELSEKTRKKMRKRQALNQ